MVGSASREAEGIPGAGLPVSQDSGIRICLVFCAQALWRRCRIRSIGRPFLGNALIAAALRIHLRIPLMDGGLAA